MIGGGEERQEGVIDGTREREQGLEWPVAIAHAPPILDLCRSMQTIMQRSPVTGGGFGAPFSLPYVLSGHCVQRSYSMFNNSQRAFVFSLTSVE